MLQTVVNPPLTPALVDRLEGIWVAVTNAGGAVGFAAPVTPSELAHGVAAMWDDVIDGDLDLVVAADGDPGDPADVVGFAFLRRGRAVSAHRGEVLKLQRDPAAAGRGIGQAVLRAVEDRARAVGVALLTLDVRGGTGREALYAAHGYTQVAVLPGWVRIGEVPTDLIVMAKDLDGGGVAVSRTGGAGAREVGPVGDGLVLPVVRLDPDLPLPSYARAGDAGLDLHARERKVLPPGTRTLMPTGVAVAIPDGYVGLVHPRSGTAVRQGLSIVNTPGTIDAGYRGEIMVPLINHDPSATIRLERGDRIAQLLLQRVERAQLVEVDALPAGVRGEGGFGSTGR